MKKPSHFEIDRNSALALTTKSNRQNEITESSITIIAPNFEYIINNGKCQSILNNTNLSFYITVYETFTTIRVDFCLHTNLNISQIVIYSSKYFCRQMMMRIFGQHFLADEFLWCVTLWMEALIDNNSLL